MLNGGSLIYEWNTPLSSHEWFDPSLQQPITLTRSNWFFHVYLTRISHVFHVYFSVFNALIFSRVNNTYLTREIRVKYVWNTRCWRVKIHVFLAPTAFHSQQISYHMHAKTAYYMHAKNARSI